MEILYTTSQDARRVMRATSGWQAPASCRPQTGAPLRGRSTCAYAGRRLQTEKLKVRPVQESRRRRAACQSDEPRRGDDAGRFTNLPDSLRVSRAAPAAPNQPRRGPALQSVWRPGAGLPNICGGRVIGPGSGLGPARLTWRPSLAQ